MADIIYGKGEIAAEQYNGRIKAEKLSSFVCEHFYSMFKESANPRGKLSLQNSGPSQNSANGFLLRNTLRDLINVFD